MAIRKPQLTVIEARRLALGAQGTSEAAELDRAPAPPVPGQGRGAGADGPAKPAVADHPRSPAYGEARPTAQPLLETVERVQVFVSAFLPAQGVSRIYDQLCLEYRPAKALQMILRRALDDYEVLLEGGVSRVTAPAYASTRTIVQTSRMMPVHLLTAARALFDPLGMESSRIFGRKLASAALAVFFDAERKQAR